MSTSARVQFDGVPEASSRAPMHLGQGLGEAKVRAVRPGAIILARHGQPALSRKCWLTSDQYAQWWGLYEAGGLKPGQTPPQALIHLAQSVGEIHASTRRRARETAAAVAGSREVVLDELYPMSTHVE